MVRYLHEMLAEDHPIALTGTLLQEILQAFRDEVTFRRIVGMLEAFPFLPLDRHAFVFAADLHRTCASRGISCSTTDCQIAAAAILHDCDLLTTDRDFERIAQHSSLLLAKPV